MDTWAMIEAERRELADLFATLDDEQLATPSLCGAWSVKEVAAHLLMPLDTSVATIGVEMVKCLGNFDRANERLAKRVAERPIADIVEGLRTHAASHFTPPTAGAEAPLTDLLVHGEDVRRPLGLPGTVPADRLRTALDFLQSNKTRGFVGKGWLRDLRFEATDLDWTHGAGALVRGPGIALVITMCGRRAGLDDLDGDGVATLASRLP
jgi:uncharacterized protein (TIGR03083 family)